MVRKIWFRSLVESYQGVKNVLDAYLFKTLPYNLGIKGKRSNQEKEVAPSPTPNIVAFEKNVPVDYSWKL